MSTNKLIENATKLMETMCDDTPVDAEWLRSLKPDAETGEPDAPEFAWTNESGWQVLTIYQNWDAVWIAEVGDGNEWPHDIHARAQVRRLFFALEYDVKEQP